MRIVDEAVQDGIGVGRIVYGLMPAGHWKLAGNEGGALAVAVLKDFEEVVPGVAVERLKPPIVQDQRNRCTRPTYSVSLLMSRLGRDDEEIGQCRMRLMQAQTVV
jgi:hypothetical protein